MVPRTVQQPMGTVFRSIILAFNYVNASNQLSILFGSTASIGMGIVA